MKMFTRVFAYVWPEMRKYPLSGILLFVGYGVGVVFDNILKPYIYKNIIDELTSNQSHEIILAHVITFVIYLAVTILIYNLGYRLGDYTNSYFQSKVMKDLYDSAFHRILRHSYTFFSNTFSGSIVAKTKRFSKSFETFFDVVSYQVWFSLVSLVGILIVLSFTNPLLTLLFLVWTVVYVGITFFFISKKIHLDTLEAESDSKVTASLADSILNVINIKVFATRVQEEKHFNVVTEKEELYRRKAWYFANMQSIVQAGLMAVLQISLISLNIYLWNRGLITVGTIMLTQVYVFGLFDILWGLGRAFTKAVKALTDMKEIVDIFDLVPDVLDPKHPQKLQVTEGKVEFVNVAFSYKEGITIFDNFNLTIAPGERIGLVGHSGAGKSTITKLLLRFADVTGGKIMLDGQDITHVTQDNLRGAVSYVPQETVLFHRSIRDNIAYGKPDATDEEVWEAAQKAHAHEFISTLPQGYNTLVGERGVKLSGGERQRVAIARAMLKNAPILVLDEATSSLDSVSESYIQEAFDELMKGKTTIVIAHRLSTIQKMDRIIVLENGAIIEEGTHKQLLKKKGVYADLWEHQSGGFIE
jgi:ATP-binding cassette subfamily B protein